MNDYYLSIFFSEKNGGYIPDVPDLKYCSALGKTREETLKEVQVAGAAWIEAARELGKPVPAPRKAGHAPQRHASPQAKLCSQVLPKYASTSKHNCPKPSPASMRTRL